RSEHQVLIAMRGGLSITIASRFAAAFLLCTVALCAPVQAQEAPREDEREVVVRPPAQRSCDVDLEHRLACLNAAFARTSGAPAPDVGKLTLNTHSAPIALGLINDAAQRQRMGAAYGVSVHPQRPTSVVPLARGAP